MTSWLIFSLACAVIALIYGALMIVSILKQKCDDEKMKEIAKAIQDGAAAYLNRQYKTIGAIGIIVTILLGMFLSWTIATGFVVGAVLSALAGYIGMNISVRANIRTADAAKKGM